MQPSWPISFTTELGRRRRCAQNLGRPLAESFRGVEPEAEDGRGVGSRESLLLAARFGAALLYLPPTPSWLLHLPRCSGQWSLACWQELEVHMSTVLTGSRLVQTELGKACCAICNALEERLHETAPHSGKRLSRFCFCKLFFVNHVPNSQMQARQQIGHSGQGVAGPEALGQESVLLSSLFSTSNPYNGVVPPPRNLISGSNPFSLFVVGSTTPTSGATDDDKDDNHNEGGDENGDEDGDEDGDDGRLP